MLLTDRVRSTVLAAVGALVLVMGSTIAAQAAPKGPAQPNLCYAFDPVSGTSVFYLPGETIIRTDKDGVMHTLECGADGNWKDISRTAPDPRTRPMGPNAPTLSH